VTTGTVTVARRVAATPDRVFGAWTDAERLAAWWWPQLAGTTYDVDARPGGTFRIHSPAIGATVTGVYTEVDPPWRLAFSWRWEDAGERQAAVEDTVTVTFAPDDGGTLVTVVHASTAHVRGGGAEQGWNDVMDRLARVVGQSTSSRS
jgi:uncharacterized protein YndB with AHSA1/START domain